MSDLPTRLRKAWTQKDGTLLNEAAREIEEFQEMKAAVKDLVLVHERIREEGTTYPCIEETDCVWIRKLAVLIYGEVN